MKEKTFLYRLYFYFRRGYTTYIGFAVGVLNFLVIQYRLLIEKVPLLESLFAGKFIIFAIVMLILLSIAAILIGWWDMKKGSFPEEARVSWQYNPEFQWLKCKIEEIERKLDEIKNKS